MSRPSPKPNTVDRREVLDLETLIFDAVQSVQLVSLMAHKVLDGIEADPNSRVTIFKHERDMILFALSQADIAVARADDAYQSVVSKDAPQ